MNSTPDTNSMSLHLAEVSLGLAPRSAPDFTKIAKRLVANIELYGRERDRVVTRYRISWNALSELFGTLRSLSPWHIDELNAELFQLRWHLFQLGTEFCLVELGQVTSWVKLSNKRIADLTDEQIDQVLANRTVLAIRQSPQEE